MSIQSRAEIVSSGVPSPTSRFASTKKIVSHSYFVVMEDFAQRGLEANVTPEITRRAVVEFIARGNYRDIVFIHHVDGLNVEDVTAELLNEAEQIALQAAE